MGEISGAFDTTKEMNIVKAGELGVTENYFADRVESVTDRATNNLLFSMYKDLIEPVEEIERFTVAINHLEESRRGLEASVRVKKWPAYTVIVFYCILCMIVSFVLSHIKVFSDLIVKTAVGLNIQDAALYLGITLVIPVIIILIVEPLSINRVKKSRNKKNKSRIPEVDASLAELVKERNDKTRTIMDRICYVPPKYRTSRALTSFVTDYGNSKVDNLKEAIDSYDKKCSESRLTEGLNMIYRRLRDIEYVQYK